MNTSNFEWPVDKKPLFISLSFVMAFLTVVRLAQYQCPLRQFAAMFA